MAHFADSFLWVLWHVTAALMIAGVLYLFASESSLFSQARSRAQVALAIDTQLGTTYITGALQDVLRCDRVSVQSTLQDNTATLAFSTEKKGTCTDSHSTAVTFVSSFPGRPHTIEVTVDGVQVNTITKSL